MKSYWNYRCDEGHSWQIIKDINDEELAEDEICPYGHEAVVLTKNPFVDIVQVSLRSSGRIVDTVTGRIGFEKFYFIVLTDFYNDRERVSKSHYKWEEAIKLIEQFRDINPKIAWIRMDKMDLKEG